MTELLASAVRRTGPVATALTAGVAAAGSTLLLAVGVALTGWFAADAGRYGDTRDAVRVGADAWLLAHGAGLGLDTVTVTIAPLALTLLSGFAVFRAAARAASVAGLTGRPSDLRPALTCAGVLATGYGLVAMVTAVLAAHPAAEPDLLRALLGGFLLGLVAGGAGVAAGSRQGRVLLGGLPDGARAVLLAGAASVLAVLTAAAALVAGALVADFGTAATVLSRLHLDGAAGLMFTLVGVGFVPNAVLLAVGYLLGPGFVVGTGTVVSPSLVALGPVPAFPLLAALPGDGATPDWAGALVGVPVLLTVAATALAFRVLPTDRVEHGALRGLAGGLLAALALTCLVALAGGAAGPGRMSEVGAPVGTTLLAAVVSCGGGGLLGGGLGACWRRPPGTGTYEGR